MSNPTHKRPEKNKKTSLVRYCITLLILIAIPAAIFFSGGFGPWQREKETPQSSPPTPLPPGPQRTKSPCFTALQSNCCLNASQKQPGSAIKDVASSSAENAATLPVEYSKPNYIKCDDLALELHHFFSSLDRKPYIEAFALQSSLQDHFTRLVDTLLENPPTVSRETDDLYTLLTNMAHFFPIIGKDNILLIKSILDRERDVIEDIGLALYGWITQPHCSSDIFTLKAPLEKLYEYAGFFLNTMGGRSYLFRRDSRSRLLINYYSVRIVDKANSNGINRHGINIAEALPLLINEIEATNQLVYKELYLDHLYQLLESYQ